jgi:7,8-dihydropterin-6-yl-methyl-4-(beta-D-ribofuranosyl)aminobenzene 5'-phosphate synthase
MGKSFDRRRFLQGSGAAMALAVAPRAMSQPRMLEVPTVDGVTIRVITDSSYDTPRVGTSKWVKVKRAGLSAGDYRKTLHNEWGLALALESRKGGETRNILLDFGWTPAALLNNMEIIGVDGARAEALIVSHGHFDHFGGLVGFLEKHRSKLPASLTLYVGGEDVFCRRKRSGAPGGHLSDAGWLDRRELEKLNVRVVTCEKPTAVLGHAFTTGHIARNSFETVLPSQVVEYFPSDGIGCNIPAANEKAQGKAVKDEHIHEHGTCFNLRDRGLIVMSSCGHSGIINTTRQAMEVSGVKKVHAMLGGFHLFPADEAYLRKTIAEMKALDPDVIIPMHCSGPSLLALLRSEMSDRVLTSTTGTEFTFGA